jgi:hypothetical protein
LNQHIESVAASAVVGLDLRIDGQNDIKKFKLIREYLELPLHDLRSVDTKCIRYTVGIVQGKNGVTTDVAVTVVEIFLDWLDKRL